MATTRRRAISDTRWPSSRRCSASSTWSPSSPCSSPACAPRARAQSDSTGSGPVAALPLAARAAGAGLVPAALRVLGGIERDDLRRRSAAPEPLAHEAHRPVDVVEERLVARAEVVEAGLTVRRLDEPVLGAAAVTGEADVALPAVARKRVALVEAEPQLLLRRDQLEHVRLADVPEPVRRLDEVIARVEVPGVLERESEPARLRVDAEARWLAEPVGERDVEHLDVDLADVPAHPLLEDVDQEAPVLLGGYRTPGDARALLDVERAVTPRRPRHASVLRSLGDPLDDGDELDEACVAFVTEEAVDLGAVAGVGRVDGRERVPFHPGPAKPVESGHDVVEGALPALVHSVGVV